MIVLHCWQNEEEGLLIQIYKSQSHNYAKLGKSELAANAHKQASEIIDCLGKNEHECNHFS